MRRLIFARVEHEQLRPVSTVDAAANAVAAAPHRGRWLGSIKAP
jgi:hypothetical protein